MSNEKLIQVKLTIAAKYEHRAKLSGSKPRRATLMRHANAYRLQAADLAKRSK